MPEEDITKDPRYMAAVDLIGRTGASQFKIGYTDDDAPPVVWYVCALFGEHWEVTGAQGPLLALFRMLEALIDGGECQHCHRPTGFEQSTDTDPMPLNELVCWYQWDPSTKKYARGCAK
jgi:hypothetical protein